MLLLATNCYPCTSKAVYALLKHNGEAHAGMRRRLQLAGKRTWFVTTTGIRLASATAFSRAACCPSISPRAANAAASPPPNSVRRRAAMLSSTMSFTSRWATCSAHARPHAFRRVSPLCSKSAWCQSNKQMLLHNLDVQANMVCLTHRL